MQADMVLALADRLADGLEAAQPEVLLPGLGSFKPTQMLLRLGEAVVIDLDAVALADPAADVGLLSGLSATRPASGVSAPACVPGLTQRLRSSCAGYRRVMLDVGIAPGIIDGILERVRMYEAAKLFRIAVRPVTRGNSARPQELAAICGDIAECLDQPARWKIVSLLRRVQDGC